VLHLFARYLRYYYILCLYLFIINLPFLVNKVSYIILKYRKRSNSSIQQICALINRNSHYTLVQLDDTIYTPYNMKYIEGGRSDRLYRQTCDETARDER